MADPRETYTDPHIADILDAAQAITERVYEVHPSVPPPLQSACQALADAVYQWHESLDLQHELVGEGVRAGAVSDLGDATYATSYAANVQRVLAASDQLHVMASRGGDAGLPASADPLIEALGQALTQWDRQTLLASSWQREGGRPLVLHPRVVSISHPPDDRPPGARRPAGAQGSSSDEASQHHDLALAGGDDPHTAARAATGAAAAAPVGGDGRPSPDPVAPPLAAGPSGERDQDRRRRERARQAAQHARQRGAVAR